jgi:hypothetical protein
MMLRHGRLGAGHGFALGLVLGLTLAGGHPWLLLGIGFALGLAASTLTRLGRRLAGYAAERLRPPEPVPSGHDAEPASIRDTRAELIGRLHTDVSLLAATLPRRRRR